jgi:hypothetical protein
MINTHRFSRGKFAIKEHNLIKSPLIDSIGRSIAHKNRTLRYSIGALRYIHRLGAVKRLFNAIDIYLMHAVESRLCRSPADSLRRFPGAASLSINLFKQKLPYTIHADERARLLKWFHGHLDISIGTVKIGQPERVRSHERYHHFVADDRVMLVWLR